MPIQVLIRGLETMIEKIKEVIEKEMNLSMKELAKLRCSTTPSTGSSTSSNQTVTTTSTKSSTRRRLVNKESVSIKQMQKHSFDTQMNFD